jgi:hypothetical protein
VILPPSPHLFQNGFLSVLSSIKETKVERVGKVSHIVFDEHARLCSAPVSPFSVFVSLDFLCMAAHAFIPEILSNHHQGLCCAFSEICTKFDAVPLWDPSRNHIGPVQDSK